MSAGFVLAGNEPAGRIATADAELSVSVAAGEPRAARVRLEATQLERGATYSTALSASVDRGDVDVEVLRRGNDCDEAPACSVDYDVVLTAAEDAEVVVSLHGVALSIDARGGCGGRKQPSLVVIVAD